MPTIQKTVTSVSAIAVLPVTVTAAAGSAGQSINYSGQASAFTLVNLSQDSGVEYRVGSEPWQYLGKKVGVRLDVNPASVRMRLVNDGAASVSMEISVESIARPGEDFPVVAPATSRTQMILGDSISQRGTHMPLSLLFGVDPDRVSATQSWSMPNLSAGGTFISTIEILPGFPTGAGVLRYEAATRKLYLTAPGDTEGQGVEITDEACFYAIPSGNPAYVAYLGMIPANRPPGNATDNITVAVSTYARKCNVASIGILPLTNALLGSPYSESYAFSIAGNTAVAWLKASAQWENVFTDDTDIIVGTNGWVNFNPPRAAALEQLAAIEKIIQKRQAVGSRVTISGLFPYNARTTAERQVAAEMTVALQQMAERYNIRICDAFSLMADPTTGNYRVGDANTSDNLHPSNLGSLKAAAYKWVDAKADLLDSSNVAIPPIPLYDATVAPYGNLLPNGALTGTGGTLGTRATGTVPDTYIATCFSGSVMKVNSIAPADPKAYPRFNGKPGNCLALEVDNTGGVNGEIVQFGLASFSTTAGKYAAGDRVVIEAEIAVFGTGVIAIGVLAATTIGSNWALFMDTSATNALGDLDGKVAIFKVKSAPMLIEAGATNLNPLMQMPMLANGVAVVLIDPNFVLRKV